MKTFEYISQIKRNVAAFEMVRLNIPLTTEGTNGEIFTTSHITIRWEAKQYVVDYHCKKTDKVLKTKIFTRFKLLKKEYAR